MTYELRQNGELKFEGTEEKCYIRLLRCQSQTIDEAINTGGWTVKPKHKIMTGGIRNTGTKLNK